MSLDAKQSAERVVVTVDDLLQYFREAEKGAGPLRIGLEHEKLIYPVNARGPVPYEGASGIGAVLRGFEAFGWKPFVENGTVIAMTRGEATLSLEPGGQLELSGAPAANARLADAENTQHLNEARQVLSKLGLRMVALGYRPFERIADMPWMPKSRYGVMRQTLGARGRLAHNMMLMTATGQVSLDWRDEADCAEKMHVAALVSPVLVALYANSPLVEGANSGFQSFRSHVWTDVDRARCGYIPAMLDGSFSYRAYTEWALDAPLLFLRRQGRYLSPAVTFRQLLKDGFEGQPALYDDWVDHLSTLFPEVRIKRVLEIRAADCCTGAMTGALCAVMRGLLYDAGARRDLKLLLGSPAFAQHLNDHAQAQREGLDSARFAGLARDVVAIARAGLRRFDPEDAPLLDVLEERAKSGRSPARDVLETAPTPEAIYARFGP
jgi:glutamate--cysteine ligase